MLLFLLGFAGLITAEAAPIKQVRIEQNGDFSGWVESKGRQYSIDGPVIELSGEDTQQIKLWLAFDTQAGLPPQGRTGDLREARIQANVNLGRRTELKDVHAYFAGQKRGDINCSKVIKASMERETVRLDLKAFRTFLDCDFKDKERLDPLAAQRDRFITPVSTRLGIPFLTMPLNGEGEDRKLGQNFMRQYNSEHFYSILPPDHPTTRYVRRLTHDLLKGAGRDTKSFNIEVFVVNSDVMNAFAVPGGPLYVFRGLIEEAEDEAQLAGVMGHEIAHVTARHYSRGMTIFMSEIVQRIVAAYGVSVVLGGVIKDKDFKEIVNTALYAYAGISALRERFHKGRQYELEADRYGAQYAQNAGFEPWGIASVFELFTRRFGDKPRNWIERELASHPRHGERVSQILDLTAFFYPRRAPYRDPRPMEFLEARRAMQDWRRPTASENERILGFMETSFKEMTEQKLDERLRKTIKVGR